MVQNEKSEFLSQRIHYCGFVGDDVALYWAEKRKWTSDNLVISTLYKTPSKVLPGMYVYVDGLIYPEIIKGWQVKAVVGYVDGSEVLAVCLRQKNMHWTIKDSFRNPQSGTPIALQWCCDYKEDGVKRGEAFLPSVCQLKKIAKYCDIINVSLRALRVRGVLLGGRYWSSDGDRFGASSVYLPFGTSKYDDFSYCYCHAEVRPFIKISY